MSLSFLPISSRQRGSMLLISLFSMIVLAGLAMALLKINTSSQTITSREVLGGRAWFAASSGNEWAMTQLFPLAMKANQKIVKASCSFAPSEAPKTIVFPASIKGLSGCSVSVSCTLLGAGALSQFYIESKGVCGTGEMKVVRVQELWAKGI